MSYVVLRTLTMKSVHEGVKYGGQRIETIIKIDPVHIAYCYYNYSKITFNDEVLNAIGITEEWRITKPGKDLEKLHKFNLHNVRQLNELERNIHFSRKKAIRKREHILTHSRHVNLDRRTLSRASLANVNRQYTPGFHHDYKPGT